MEHNRVTYRTGGENSRCWSSSRTELESTERVVRLQALQCEAGGLREREVGRLRERGTGSVEAGRKGRGQEVGGGGELVSGWVEAVHDEHWHFQAIHCHMASRAGVS